MSIVHRQRLTFIGIMILVGIATHFAYTLARPEWVVYRQAENKYQDKEWAEAIPLYEKSFSMGLTSPVAMLRIAQAYGETQEFPKAIYWYQRYLALKPNDARVRRSLAGVYQGNGEFEKAALELRKIVNQNEGEQDEEN